MNQPTQQSQEPSAAATSGNGVAVVNVPTLEERSAALFETAPSESAANADGSPVPPGAAALAADPAGADPIAEARAKRRAEYDRLAAQERTRVDAQQRHREQEDWKRRAEDAEKRAEAVKGYVDPSKLDEPTFFDLAKRIGVTPQKLGEWLREQAQNPEVAAAQAASRIVDPKLSAMEQKIADYQKRIDAFEQQQAAQRQQAEEAHYEQQFHAFTTANAASAPHSARFLEVHGPDEYVKLARTAAGRVPEGAGGQAILDEIEEQLTNLAKIYAPPSAAPTQQRPMQSPQNTAAAKAPTTISNTFAQTRASVVDEEAEWASLPFEERSARLFR